MEIGRLHVQQTVRTKEGPIDRTQSPPEPSPIKRCTRCILPETFPEIEFDGDGVCQYCADEHPDQREKDKRQVRARFEVLLDAVRPRSGYHCLLNWRGEESSTYALWVLKEFYHLQVLAFTLDHGFLSPQALKNMRIVSECLGIDHVLEKPRFDLLKRIFARCTRRGAHADPAHDRPQICAACTALTKGVGFRLALQERIPLICFGGASLSPSSALIELDRDAIVEFVHDERSRLETIAHNGLENYFPDPAALDDPAIKLTLAHPLAFIDTEEEQMRQLVKTFGWEPMDGLNGRSEPCLLSTLAIQAYRSQSGYHPYVAELAQLVREGVMERARALALVEAPSSPSVLAAVQAKLDLPLFEAPGY